MTETSKKKNRGYSLIELIVTIAIASILVIVVGTVMVSSATSYSAANAEATVQTRAQIVMNQIEDLVIDTRGGVDYGYMSGADSVTWGNLKDPEDMSQPYGKRLRLYNVYTGRTTPKQVCELEWKSEDKKLLYREYDSADGENTTSSTEEVLSENVTDFACDLSEVSTNRVLKVDLVMNRSHLRRDREYHAYKNISLRNPITVSGSAITSENEISLINTNKNITVEPGLSLALYGAKVVILSGTPSTDVEYYLINSEKLKISSTSDGTKIEDGKTLKVSSAEKAASFTVRAAAVADPDKTTDITVYVRRVNKVEIVSMTASPRAIPGSTVTVTAKVSSQADINITKKDREKLNALEFTITPAVSDLKTSGSTCTFTIPANAQEGRKYRVSVEALHARANGGMTRGAYEVEYEPDNAVEVLGTNTIEVIESGSTVSTVLDEVIYRGQEAVNLMANPYSNISTGSASVTGHIFLYRRSVESAWGFTSDIADSIPDGWTVIPTHTNTSFTVPTEVYADAGFDEERSYQFAAVASLSNGKYQLCGRGVFKLPAFKLQINGETDGRQLYRIFELRGDNALPRNGSSSEIIDPVHIGQVERAFGGVRYKGTGSDSETKSYYANFTVENWDKEKEIDKDYIETALSDTNNFDFRITKLGNAKIEFPSYPGGTVSYNKVYKLKDEYELGVSEVEYEGNKKTYSKGDEPCIEVETYIGNAVFQVRASGYSETNPVYDYLPVFIPVPGSDDDLLRYYSLQQLQTTYRPAGDTQGVYINTMKKDGTTWKKYTGNDKNTRYLIQMRVVSGVRYIRVWYPKTSSIKVASDNNTFTGTPEYFIGEYKYDSDDELWKRINTTAPTQY
ncbi:MAG: prepilin-type N-terminal cleavage/methylation domain-containing protein [Lachnospiraceae bacterium]|nr:prepilin-type N-terminal cleavage/methylation domain-containing protein [Lachnospiraceae bacterium]